MSESEDKIQLTSLTTEKAAFPIWSPDGKKIYFARIKSVVSKTKQNSMEEDSDIYVLNLASHSISYFFGKPLVPVGSQGTIKMGKEIPERFVGNYLEYVDTSAFPQGHLSISTDGTFTLSYGYDVLSYYIKATNSKADSSTGICKLNAGPAFPEPGTASFLKTGDFVVYASYPEISKSGALVTRETGVISCTLKDFEGKMILYEEDLIDSKSTYYGWITQTNGSVALNATKDDLYEPSPKIISQLKKIAPSFNVGEIILSPDQAQMAYIHPSKKSFFLLETKTGNYTTFPVGATKLVSWSADGMRILATDSMKKKNILIDPFAEKEILLPLSTLGSLSPLPLDLTDVKK